MSCKSCFINLQGQEYVEHDGSTLCVKCFETKFANKCAQCYLPIRAGEKEVIFGSNHHFHEECFLCSGCQKPLKLTDYESFKGKPYCSTCYASCLPAGGKCSGCGNNLKSNEERLEYKNQLWHKNCFNCSLCKKSIANVKFHNEKNQLICTNCYQQNVAQRCAKCQNPITGPAVKSKNDIFHKQCFICVGCGKELAGKSVASHNNDPYCIDCYGKMFAKRCANCKQPITGAGGMQFVSYEDRNWHKQCFMCFNCGKNLADASFNTIDEKISCASCAEKFQ